MFKFNGTRKPDFRNIKSIDYDQYWRERGVSIQKKLKEREVIMRDTIKSGSKVYDIGCGTSRLPLCLKENGCSVKVSDLSKIILEEFERNGIRTSVLDLRNINEKDVNEYFDYIIMSEVLEHLYNPEDVVKILSKKTKRFLLTIPNSAFYRYRIHLLFFGRFFTQWAFHPSEHIRYWSHKDFMDWLWAMDLTVDKVMPSNGFSILGIPIFKWWPNMFAHQIVYVCNTNKTKV